LLTAFVGLALSIASNVIVFENIRKHTAVGKTMQSSIKAGYKDTLMTVADIHIVLFVVAILLAFVGAGEVASCGLILVISTIASYVIYWFTRFMWYVLSSPVRDKFKFGGYKRVVYDD
jgi:SecD/SecF fusion protein